MHIQSYLEKYFANSGTSYYVKDKNCVYKDVNQSFLFDCKKESSNDIIGQKDIDLWDQAYSFYINDQKIILKKKSNIYMEDMIFENERRIYLSFKSPYFSTLGKVIGTCGISFLVNHLFPIEIFNIIQKIQHATPDVDILTIPQKKNQLSHRQKLCLHFFARGMTIKEIAKMLLLSPKTVENYLAIIKIKLNCSTRYELVEKAFELDLI